MYVPGRMSRYRRRRITICMKFLVTLTKQIEIVVEADDLVSAKDEGEYLGNIELRDEIDRNKAVDWTLTKIEGI